MLVRRKVAGRQDSQPVFSVAKSLILLAQKTRFTPQMYSELAQFFKARKGRVTRPFQIIGGKRFYSAASAQLLHVGQFLTTATGE